MPNSKSNTSVFNHVSKKLKNYSYYKEPLYTKYLNLLLRLLIF